MNEPARRPKLVPIVITTVAALLVVLRLTGLLSVGIVATESMEPTLPAGALFLSLPSDPTIGDIVVFDGPSGGQIVHRVVDIEAEGLVTQGDANHITDQDAGWPHVDPGTVQVVPTPGKSPLSLATPVKGLAVIALLQVALLGLGLIGGVRMVKRGFNLRPHHLLLGVALGLVLAAPLFGEDHTGPSEVQLSSSYVPIVAHVSNGEDSGTWRLGASETRETGIRGPADVSVVPAVPGAAFLIDKGPRLAMLPFALSIGVVAVIMRVNGG